jgi:hypothetical protein
VKYKTKKLANLEKNRFSIFTDNLNICMFCGMKATDLNEIFRGRNRQNSMKYGAVIPLCRRCHCKITDNYNLEMKWKIKGQEKIMNYYNINIEEFINIFGRNYL